MSREYKVKGHDHLVKIGSVILSNDESEYKAAKERQKRKKEIDNKLADIESVKERLNNVEASLSNIEILLMQLVNKK